MSPRARVLRPDHPVDRELLRVPEEDRALVNLEIAEMILCVRERPSSAARLVVNEYLRDPAAFRAHRA